MPSTSTDRLAGLSTSVAVKAPCKAVAIANITLSGAQTVNGVACVADDRVLVTAQTSGVDNGIWVCDTGAWSRAKDFDGARDVVTGTMVLVKPGSGAEEFWFVTTTGFITIGTTAIVFEQHTPEDLAIRADLIDTSDTANGDAKIGVKRAATGALARTQHAKNADILSAADFLALDGSTNDAAALALALADGSGDVTVVFPAGKTCLLSSTVTLPARNVTLIGFGATITRATAGNIFLRQDRGYKTNLIGLTFTGAAVAFKYNATDLDSGPTACFNTEYFEVSVSQCVFKQAATTQAIVLYGSRESEINNCLFEDNLGVYTSYSVNTTIHGNVFKNCATAVQSDVGSQGLRFSDNTVIGGNYGIAATGTAATANTGCAGVWIDGNTIDYVNIPIALTYASSVAILGNYLTGRVAGTPVATLDYCTYVTVANNPQIQMDVASTASTFYLSNCVDWKFSGNTLTGPPSGTCTYGVYAVNSTYGNVHDNYLGTGFLTTAIYLDATSSGKIHDNTLLSGSARINVNGCTTDICNNTGFVTENSGNTASGTGSAAFTIAHGLAMTPTIGKTAFTLTGLTQAGLQVVIASVDATNITFNASAVITVDFSVAWSARIKA